jgi:hypothetical protein
MIQEDLDKVISDEMLRSRIRKIITGEKRRKIDNFLRHPLFMLVAGFALTWGVGQTLSNKFKRNQLENEKKIEEIKSKRQNGFVIINQISELLYARYTVSSLLESSLKRNATIEELKDRKKAYDEIYMKWNTNIQITELAVRDITSDSVFSRLDSIIQKCLSTRYRQIDQWLTEGYDAKINHQKWEASKQPIAGSLLACLNCSYAISNYLWIRANLYGDDQYNSKKIIAQAEQELNVWCRSVK